MEPSMQMQALEAARTKAAPAALLDALAGAPAFLVGGAVRDALLGRATDDIDIAVDGELDPILDRLGIEAHTHERFGTASIALSSIRIDLARTRRERYPEPGALPEVSPAPIRTDLARRDFTINAMAVPLTGPPELIDPYGGGADLDAGLIRVIHPRSFVDDPTRALRAIRYLARLSFRLERETERLLAAADLGAVSRDRVEADLARICAEPTAPSAIRMLAERGLLDLDAQRAALIDPLAELALLEPWAHLVERSELLFDLITAGPERIEAARELADAAPGSSGGAFELARRHDELTLATARAMGARWIDSYVSEWRRVRLQIDGRDLLAAGVAEGPAVGRGLRAARDARIEGRIEADRDAELAVALAAARGGDGPSGGNRGGGAG